MQEFLNYVAHIFDGGLSGVQIFGISFSLTVLIFALCFSFFGGRQKIKEL